MQNQVWRLRYLKKRTETSETIACVPFAFARQALNLDAVGIEQVQDYGVLSQGRGFDFALSAATSVKL